jgi:hypothetical protein
VGESGGSLTPAHLLARVLDQQESMVRALGKIETQIAVHLESHKTWSKVHRTAYAGLIAVASSLTGLLASHWK